MSDNAIVRHEGSVFDIGTQFAASGYFPNAATAARAITRIVIGRGMGLSDFESMSGLHIIEGKPVLASTLMATLIKRSGRYRYEIRQADAEACVLEFFEKEDGAWRPCGPPVSFTKDDAQKAELSSKPNYRKFAQDMLFARALSRGYRRYCPDAIGGPVYVEGEIVGDDDAPAQAAPPALPPDMDITEHPLVKTAEKLFDAEVVSVDGVPVAKPEARNADAPPDIDI